MCTAEAAGLSMQVGGLVSSTASSYYGAKTQQSALKTEAGFSANNAKIAELAAQSELASGVREEQAKRLSTAQMKSTQRSSLADRGIDLSSDTALNILTSTDAMGEVDAQTIHANAARSAWGYRTQGMNYTNQSMMQTAGAKAISPGSAAATSLLVGGSSVASKWREATKSGAMTDSVSQWMWS